MSLQLERPSRFTSREEDMGNSMAAPMAVGSTGQTFRKRLMSWLEHSWLVPFFRWVLIGVGCRENAGWLVGWS